MHEAIQQQLFSHYKIWYNNRTKTDITEINKVTCNRCRKKFDKNIMTSRIYGAERKTFYYCPVCSASLKNPK